MTIFPMIYLFMNYQMSVSVIFKTFQTAVYLFYSAVVLGAITISYVMITNQYSSFESYFVHSGLIWLNFMHSVKHNVTLSNLHKDRFMNDVHIWRKQQTDLSGLKEQVRQYRGPGLSVTL